jgi:hypothetical protein
MHCERTPEIDDDWEKVLPRYGKKGMWTIANKPDNSGEVVW